MKVVKDRRKFTLNNIFLFLSILVILITAIVSIVSLSVNAKDDIRTNSEHIEELKNDCVDTHTLLKTNSDRLLIVETKFNYISKQLDIIMEKIDK